MWRFSIVLRISTSNSIQITWIWRARMNFIFGRKERIAQASRHAVFITMCCLSACYVCGISFFRELVRMMTTDAMDIRWCLQISIWKPKKSLQKIWFLLFQLIMPVWAVKMNYNFQTLPFIVEQNAIVQVLYFWNHHYIVSYHSKFHEIRCIMSKLRRHLRKAFSFGLSR